VHGGAEHSGLAEQSIASPDQCPCRRDVHRTPAERRAEQQGMNPRADKRDPICGSG
jgi:hypothetical protein